jgi:hypothetical protein
MTTQNIVQVPSVEAPKYEQLPSLFATYIGKYCIVRTESAGVFAGVILATEISQGVVSCKIAESRRMWSWQGAFTLSELATTGTKQPDKCKFPAPVPEEIVFDVIEVLPCTDIARQIIESVPITAA